jgi:hypothetical protein
VENKCGYPVEKSRDIHIFGETGDSGEKSVKCPRIVHNGGTGCKMNIWRHLAGFGGRSPQIHTPYGYDERNHLLIEVQLPVNIFLGSQR